jgi:transcriptional regulator with XRE-family HTH domain
MSKRPNYGRAIKSLRGFRCMTQRDLAKAIKVNASFVSMLEAGIRNPSIETLEQIAHVLKLPVWRLVHEAEIGGAL